MQYKCTEDSVLFALGPTTNEAGSLKSRFKVKGTPDSPVSKEQVATAFAQPGESLGGFESITAIFAKDIVETALACNSPEVAEIIEQCGSYVWDHKLEFAKLPGPENK